MSEPSHRGGKVLDYNPRMNRVTFIIALASALVLSLARPTAARQDIEWDDRQYESYALSYERPPALERAELHTILGAAGVTDDQKALIDDRFQSYQDKLKSSRKKMGTWYRQTFMPSGVWNNDSEVWEKARPVTEKYTKHAAKLRDNLLEDIKLVLTAEQADLWPKVQSRLKRRDTLKSEPGQMGLATVEVDALVRDVLEGLPMPEDTVTALAGYQDALDRAVAVAQAYKPAESKYKAPDHEDNDQEGFGRRWQGTMYARSVEQWSAVRDVNLAAFRRVLPTLPESVRDRARMRFYSRADRMGSWQWTQASELDFRKVAELKTLTAKQKEEIALIRADFEKEAADKAERAALETIKAQDADPYELGSREDQPGDWTKRWQERIEMERKPRERLADILTDAQHDQAGLGKKGKELEVPKFDQ